MKSRSNTFWQRLHELSKIVGHEKVQHHLTFLVAMHRKKSSSNRNHHLFKNLNMSSYLGEWIMHSFLLYFSSFVQDSNVIIVKRSLFFYLWPVVILLHWIPFLQSPWLWVMVKETSIVDNYYWVVTSILTGCLIQNFGIK